MPRHVPLRRHVLSRSLARAPPSRSLSRTRATPSRFLFLARVSRSLSLSLARFLPAAPGDVVGPNAADRYGTRSLWRLARRGRSSPRHAATLYNGLRRDSAPGYRAPVGLSPFDRGRHLYGLVCCVRGVEFFRETGRKNRIRHGQVGQTEVHEKGKVQGEAESGAQDAAAQGTECDRHELQSAQDHAAGTAQRTRTTRDTVQGQPERQGTWANFFLLPA